MTGSERGTGDKARAVNTEFTNDGSTAANRRLIQATTTTRREIGPMATRAELVALLRECMSYIPDRDPFKRRIDAALAEPEPRKTNEPDETQPARCGLCGELMPKGEEMFNYHGYSGPCPPKAVEVEGETE